MIMHTCTVVRLPCHYAYGMKLEYHEKIRLIAYPEQGEFFDKHYFPCNIRRKKNCDRQHMYGTG
jgi:hypothetical protein